MVKSNVRLKRANGAMGVVGKGLLVGLFAGTSALTQASPVTDQSVHVDDNCGNSGSSARHGSSRGGCTIQLNERFSESSTSAGGMQATFITPANFSGAVAITSAGQLIGSKPAFSAPLQAPPASAPGPIASVVSAPAAVVPQAVVPQQILAAAPPVTTPSGTTQPVGAAAPTGSNTLPAPTVSVFSVPEPGTVALLLGGFVALIGIRRTRATNK